MKDHIDQRLQLAKQMLREKRKLEAMLAESTDLLRNLQVDLRQHEDVLRTEKSDVDRLEGLSLSGLFHSILGTKEARLEKERQEYLAAKLKYDDTAQTIEETKQEIKKLKHDLSLRQHADAEYNQLIEEKRRLLSDAGDQVTQSLLVLSEQLGDLNSDSKELQEAVAVGESALRSLEQVRSELESAANWGMWDMWAGGMISTAMKHSKIDEAKASAHVAQRHLRQFQVELADAGQRLQLSLDIDGFSKFADYFFDGLIADWAVQSKIQQAREACSTAITKVSLAVHQCRRKLVDTQSQIKMVTSQRLEIIEKA